MECYFPKTMRPNCTKFSGLISHNDDSRLLNFELMTSLTVWGFEDIGIFTDDFVRATPPKLIVMKSNSFRHWRLITDHKFVLNLNARNAIKLTRVRKSAQMFSWNFRTLSILIMFRYFLRHIMQKLLKFTLAFILYEGKGSDPSH